MIPKRRRTRAGRCLLLLLLGLVTLLSSVAGQAQVDPGIRLSLSLNRTSYLFNNPGDPIQVTINLTNVSGTERLVSKGLTTAPLHLQLVFTDPAGQPITTTQVTGGGSDAPPPPTLLVEDQYVQVEAIARLAAGGGVQLPVADAKAFYILPTAGFYSVRASVSFATYPAVYRTEADGTEFARSDTATFAGVIDSNVVPFALTVDADGDGYAFPVADARIPPSHTVADCNDAVMAINPGATEIPNNGVDDDCNPATTEDAIAPVTTAATAPPPNLNGWHKTDVTVTLTATDAGSGVQSLHYTLSGATTGATTLMTPTSAFTLSAQGTTTISFFAKDQTGNQETPQTLLVKIDKTVPVLTVPASFSVIATSPAGALVTYATTATDNLTPTPTVSCTKASGTIFPIGATLVSCTATDLAGNTSTIQSFTVTVIINPLAVTQLNALIAQVNGLSGVPSGTKNSLIVKLNAAKAFLAQGNAAGACGKLTDFITEVNSLAGKKKLTGAQANSLRTAAQIIKTTLGCP